jgi:hypothetical protein
MLGDEHRVAAHGSLAAIIVWLSRRKPLGDELAGVLENHLLSLRLTIGEIASGQVETPTE